MCRDSKGWPDGLRMEACVSGGRQAALCRTQAFFPSGWNQASSFWHFSLQPRALALGFGLVAAVTPCVWLSEGFLGLFGACCHGSQLQSLAGLRLGRKEVGACARLPAGSRARGSILFLLGAGSAGLHFHVPLLSCDLAYSSFSMVGSESFRGGEGLLRL